MGDIKNINLFSLSLASWKSKTKALSGLVFLKACLNSLWMPTFLLCPLMVFLCICTSCVRAKSLQSCPTLSDPIIFNGKGWVVRKYSYDRQGENKQAREKKNHRGLCKVKPFFPRRLRSFCQRFSYSNCLDPVLQQDLSSAKQHALPRHLRTSSRELHSRHN